MQPITRRAWSPAEDAEIVALHKQYGTQWETIASRLPDRTADAVRNRCFRLGLVKEHSSREQDDEVESTRGGDGSTCHDDIGSGGGSSNDGGAVRAAAESTS